MQPSPPGPSRARHLLRAAVPVVALGLAAALAAGTTLDVAGHWQGVFLLRGEGARPLELKDDLLLGDGPRLLAGLSFSRVRTVLGRAGAPGAGQPWLELEWDEDGGSGIVRNHLPGDRELLTSFARYEDSEGNQPRGLFVGGALPDVAADDAAQNESGIGFRDARGWQHVWCNVNEGLLHAGAMTFPGQWRFLGSRVLIDDPERVVLESAHQIELPGGDTLRMDRFAYFHAGKPWFKLGIRIANSGERPVRFSYAYGDEPWVGEYGSARGNVGWVEGRIVREEGGFDPREHRWAGIVDEDSRVANFIAWMGDELPDRSFFANRPGSVLRGGPPLSSNEIFIGLEWLDRTLQPGEQLSLLLAIGLASYPAGAAAPSLPAGAAPPQ